MRVEYEYIPDTQIYPRQLKKVTQTWNSSTRSVTYAYEGPSYLVSATDSWSRVTSFERNLYGEATRIELPECHSGFGTSKFTPELVIERDHEGRLSRRSVKAIRNNAAAYNQAYVTREWVRDFRGRLKRNRVEKGNLANPNESWLETEFDFDSRGRLVKTTGPAGQETVYEWDGHGMLFKVIQDLDANDSVSRRFAYDTDANLIVAEDGTGVSTVFGTDEYGRVVSSISPDGRKTELVLDAADRLLESKLITNSTVRQRRIRNLDTFYGRVDSIEVKDGPTATATQSVAFTYNGLSRIATATDQTGRSISYYYDGFGQLRRKVDSLVSAGSGNQVVYERDLYGRVEEIVETLKRDTGSGFTDVVYRRKFTYDELDRIIEAENWGSSASAQTVSKIARDSLGNVTWSESPETSLGGGNESITAQAFDCLGRVLNKTISPRTGSALSSISLGISYDDSPSSSDLASVITRTDGLGNTSVYEYDLGGRLVRRKLPGFSETPRSRIWDYTYDEEGRLEQWVDGNGAVVKLAYNAQKQLTERWCASQGTQALSWNCSNEKFAYDNLERMYRRETYWGAWGDSSGPSSSALLFVRADHNRDEFGRTTSESFGYLDNAGAPLATKTVSSGWAISTGGEDFSFRRSLTSANGFAQSFTPDPAGKLATISLNSGPGLGAAISDFAQYRYEGMRRIRRDLNLNGGATKLWTEYSFDNLKFLTQSNTRYGAGAGSDRYDLTLGRDLVGNVTSMGYTKVSAAVGDVFELDGFDRLKVAQLDVDNLGSPSSILKQVSYDLDEAHNRDQVTTVLSPGTPQEVTTIDDYTLISGTNDYVGYTYDGNGNLISDGYYLYKYDYLDRLSEVSVLVYPAGAMASSSSQRTVSVSREDQLKRRGEPLKLSRQEINELYKKLRKREAKNFKLESGKAPVMDPEVNEGLTAEAGEPVPEWVGWYWYDPSNRRSYKLTVFESTFFAYDGWQCTDEFYTDFRGKKTYFTSDRLDEHLGYALADTATPQNWTRFGLTQDHLGSVTRVTDDSGTVVERYEHDSYGEVTVYDATNTKIAHTQASVLNCLGFAGHGLDVESGLIYMRNRYYLSDLGRFLTGDLIGAWGDAGNIGNAYAYSSNSPVQKVDPLGLSHIWHEIAMRPMVPNGDLVGGVVVPPGFTVVDMNDRPGGGGWYDPIAVLNPYGPTYKVGPFFGLGQPVAEAGAWVAGELTGASDAADAIKSAAEGDYVEAGISGFFAIPGVGKVGKGVKKAAEGVIGAFRWLFRHGDEVVDSGRQGCNVIKEAAEGLAARGGRSSLSRKPRT